MNAYVMTEDGIRVIAGAGWIDVRPDDVVLIRGEDRERRALAAVRLSKRLWVALGDEPPAAYPPSVAAEPQMTAGEAATTSEGGWPPEPPPDVDSQS